MLSFLKRLIPARFLPRLWYHRIKGAHYAKKYGHPARNMIVIGVTGTDGKTTTASMIYHVLKSQGIHAGMLTTTHFAWGNHHEVNETHKTSLSPGQLNSYLKKMEKEGITHLVLEVSSHALDQGRLAGIPIHTGVVTNLSHEHLDYHKTMEHYRDTKGKLIKKAQNIVVAGDDPFLAPLYSHRNNVITFGKMNTNHITIGKTETIATGIRTFFTIADQSLPCELKVFGDHNMLNAAACLGACIHLGLDPSKILEGLKDFPGVAGRMEKVDIGKPITVLVDYTVTPQAFQTLFKTARNIDTGKLIAVFGSCGDRDQAKRPIIGKLASELCDVVIITDEEPYFEDPDSIRQMIAAGIPLDSKATVYQIANRRAGIKKALEIAQPHDIITVCGMGNQTSMVIKDKHIPWSDRDVIKELAS
ncbi:MAG: UDP-N-acetylmuramoyl-L-alanyl-D-glutamate--2,6-diaminopimelate ligase [Candidatus Abawacabacteria bacterium]|nr:UDP-N-acetylmuramoyl-L-alanyl-D-glutamate--2,6-diaminopimelate ligase [Candidatus Abawacabacteria bacterium]